MNCVKGGICNYLGKKMNVRFSEAYILFSSQRALQGFILSFVFRMFKTIMISINMGVFHIAFFTYTMTAWECVLTNSNTTNEFYSALHCSFSLHESRSVYELRDCCWGMISSSILTSSLVTLFPCNWLPPLGAAVPNFLDRCKLLLPLPSSFSSFIF